MKQEEEEMEQFIYTINDPPVVFINAIENLINLSNAAKLLKSQQQIITNELNKLKWTGVFENKSYDLI